MTIYVGCNLCSGRINVPVGQKLSCMQCGQKDGTIVTRYKLPIHFSDSTGQANCLLYPDEVDKLMYVCNIAINDGNVYMNLLDQVLQNINFIVGFKRMGKSDSGRSLCSFVMVCLEDISKLSVEDFHTPERLKIVPSITSDPSHSATPNQQLVPSPTNVVFAKNQSDQQLVPTPTNVTLGNQQLIPSSSNIGVVDGLGAKRKLSFAVDTLTKSTLMASATHSGETGCTSANEESTSGKSKSPFEVDNTITLHLVNLSAQSTGIEFACGDDEFIVDTDNQSSYEVVVDNTKKTKLG